MIIEWTEMGLVTAKEPKWNPPWGSAGLAKRKRLG